MGGVPAFIQTFQSHCEKNLESMLRSESMNRRRRSPGVFGCVSTAWQTIYFSASIIQFSIIGNFETRSRLAEQSVGAQWQTLYLRAGTA